MAVRIPLSLKVDDWPARDRELWATACVPPGFLKGSRPASQWSKSRRKICEQAYGQWLSWALKRHLLDVEAHPGDRATSENIDAFLSELCDRVTSSSASMMAGGLKRMLDVLAPDHNWTWLGERVAFLKSGARSERDKQAHVVPPELIYDLGLRIMEEASEGEDHPLFRAMRYRDGLLIVILICRPVRMANLQQVEIGKHLHFDEERYWLCFTEKETKERQPSEGELPVGLTSYIDRYLNIYRRALLARSGDAPTRNLWIDRKGGPMTAHAIRNQVNRWTREEFGRNVWPHLFRSCAVTGLVDLAPEEIGIGPDLLNHSGPKTMRTSYLLARGMRAHRAVGNCILALRTDALQQRNSKRNRDDSDA